MSEKTYLSDWDPHHKSQWAYQEHILSDNQGMKSVVHPWSESTEKGD